MGKDADIVEVGDLLARQRVELGDLLDLVAEEADAPRHILIMRRKYLQAVAADAEIAARERLVVALVLERDELSDDLAIVGDLALLPDRKSVVSGKSVYVREDLGGRRII